MWSKSRSKGIALVNAMGACLCVGCMGVPSEPQAPHGTFGYASSDPAAPCMEGPVDPSYASVQDDPPGRGDSARRHASEAALSDAERTRLESEKIQVVPYVTLETTSNNTAYAFRDGHRWLTENEFVRRYEALVGSRDLDCATWHPKADLVGSAMLFVVAGSSFIAATTLPQGQSPGTNAGAVTFASLGALGMAVAGIWAGFALTSWDGDWVDHRMSVFAAENYAERYNRALGDGAARRTNAEQPPLVQLP